MAGVVIGERAAPIVKYMRNWSEERILAYCHRKGWHGVLMADFKKFDSQAGIWQQNGRLTKDPQIIEGGDKPMVKLTFAIESRSERHSTMWWEVTVQDRQSDLAAALQKGDVLGWAAFPAMRMWGDNNDKHSLEAVRAELFPSIELIVKLKARGWVPGQKPAAKGAKAAAKGKAKPAAKGKKQVQSLDDDDLPADA